MSRIFLILSFCFPFLAFSQEKQDSLNHQKRCRFYDVSTFSINVAGKPLINGFRTINGYRIYHGISAGIGIAAERFVAVPTYDSFKANFSLMPVFADLRYTFLQGRVSPVIALNAGYVFLLNRPSSAETYNRRDLLPPFAWDDIYYYDHYERGGLWLNAEAGVQFRTWKRYSLFASFNYSLCRVSGTRRTAVYQTIIAGNEQQQNVSYFNEKVIAWLDLFGISVGVAF